MKVIILFVKSEKIKNRKQYSLIRCMDILENIFYNFLRQIFLIKNRIYKDKEKPIKHDLLLHTKSHFLL